jgi:hypothetical protein
MPGVSAQGLRIEIDRVYKDEQSGCIKQKVAGSSPARSPKLNNLQLKTGRQRASDSLTEDDSVPILFTFWALESVQRE